MFQDAMKRTWILIVVSGLLITSYAGSIAYLLLERDNNNYSEYPFDPPDDPSRFVFPDDQGLNTTILDSLSLSGDYLLNHIEYNGRWDYEFNASSGKSNSGYNVLRHAGTTYSLALIFKYTRDLDHYNGTIRTLNYLLSRYLDLRQFKGKEVATVKSGSYTKLGGPGITLLAVVEIKRIDPHVDYDREMEALKNYIVQMQGPDGSLQCFLGDREDEHSDYYPGEALLGLAKYHQFTNDTEVLDVLRKGLDFYNRYFPDDYTAYSPWATEAISYLHSVEGGIDLNEKAIAMANSCRRGQIIESYSGDEFFIGAFSTRATSSTASRIEAVADAYLLTARVKDIFNSTRFYRSMNLCAGFLMRSQISIEDASFLPDPERSAGGIPNTRDDLTIRIDNVQHTAVVLVKIMVYQRDLDHI